MEGQTNSFSLFANPYCFPYYTPSFSYYQQYLHAAIQNANISYNQYSSSFNSINQNCQSPPSNSVHLEPNTPSLLTDHSVYIQNQTETKRSTRDKKKAIAKFNQKHAPKKQGKQKQNRNVCSNILRSFFRKINEDLCIIDLVKLIISKHCLSIGARQFLEYFRQLKINYFKYLRFKKLRYLFIDEELPQHSLIFRILFKQFKDQECLPYILTSKKIGKWSIKFHLKGGRELSEKILN